MPPDVPLHFGPYRLAGPQGPLWRAAEVVPLPPKALAVLWRLAQPGRAGGDQSDAARHGVGRDGGERGGADELSAPPAPGAGRGRPAAALHRHGASAGVSLCGPGHRGGRPPPEPPPAHGAPPAPPLVGRAAEMAQLHTCFAQAQQGARQIVFVTGEAGMGKTTLVDAVCARSWRPQKALRLGRGQCIEHYGAGEAYLPLLEALGRLGRAPGGRTAGGVPAPVCPDLAGAAAGAVPAGGAGGRAAPGAGRHPGAHAAGTGRGPGGAERPSGRWCWCSKTCTGVTPSTVEALALLARRREAARLLVLGTYRPVELILQDHPLKRVKQELVAHGHVREICPGRAQPAGGGGLCGAAPGRSGRPRGDGGLGVPADRGASLVHGAGGGRIWPSSAVLQGAACGGGPRRGERRSTLAVPAGAAAAASRRNWSSWAAEAQQVLEVGECGGRGVCRGQCGGRAADGSRGGGGVCEALARQGQFLEDRGLVGVAGWDGEWALWVSPCAVSGGGVPAARGGAPGTGASADRSPGSGGLWRPSRRARGSPRHAL